MAYETLIVEDHEAVRLIRLNRPEALNALNGALMDELTATLDAGEADPAIRRSPTRKPTSIACSPATISKRSSRR